MPSIDYTPIITAPCCHVNALGEVFCGFFVLDGGNRVYNCPKEGIPYFRTVVHLTYSPTVTWAHS